MKAVSLDKIEVKKQKVNLSISLSNDRGIGSEHSNFRTLLSIALLSGASPNCVKQTQNKMTPSRQIDYNKVQQLQLKMEELLWEMERELNIVEKNSDGSPIETKTITFR